MSKPLFKVLREKGLLEYGSLIPGELVRETLGIVYPEVGTKYDFDRLELLELSAIDQLRNHLLNDGKYLTQVRQNYRILLPSENSGQIDSYMASADGKLKRALKLLRNTPSQYRNNDQTESRILMRQEGARHRSK